MHCGRLDPQSNAQRYLNVSHGHEAITAHRQVIETVRAVARRHDKSAWRLIGLTIRIPVDGNKPTLEDFIADRDLNGRSEEDVSAMYEDAYPTDRKADHRQKLRLQQMALLKRMEVLAAETPPLAISYPVGLMT